MNSTAMIREAAVLRHTFQIKKRLQLEFLAGLSKLLREHGVSAKDELLSSVVLAVPDEMMNGDRATSNGRAHAAGAGKRGSKNPGLGPQTGTGRDDDAGLGPQTGKRGKKKPGLGPQTKKKKGSKTRGGLGPQTGKQDRDGGLGPQTGGRKKSAKKKSAKKTGTRKTGTRKTPGLGPQT